MVDPRIGASASPARWKWRLLPLLAVLCSLSTATAQTISFSYSQSDLTTGGGTLSGAYQDIFFTGELPLATVTQVDSDDLPIPEGMIGYLSGQGNPGTNGNDYGVHIGFEGSVTLTGEKVVSATVLELFELELDLVIADDGTPDATWNYSAMVTDDDGDGNDAFGQFRMAGWVGEPTMGHRHSGATRVFEPGAVDVHEMGGSHGQVDANGRGDNLGINFSFRDGRELDEDDNFVDMEDGPFTNGSGLMYVDSIEWNGGLTASNSPRRVGTSLAADFDGDGEVALSDFLILSGSFNRDNTTRVTGGDMTGDFRTDLRDWVLFREAFNSANAAGAASVPEPGTSLLLVLGLLGISPAVRRTRRSR